MTSFTFPLAERPRLVRFDPDDWILDDIEFEKSREELLYGLEHDTAVMGRHRAAQELVKFADNEEVASALPDALQALERPSHEEVIRRAAVEVLTMDGVLTEEVRKEVIPRLARLAAPGQPMPLRTEALAALGRAGRGSEEAFASLKAALEDRRLPIRLSAIDAFAVLGDRRAIPLLQARRIEEAVAVFRDPRGAIDRAIKRLESGANPEELA